MRICKQGGDAIESESLFMSHKLVDVVLNLLIARRVLRVLIQSERITEMRDVQREREKCNAKETGVEYSKRK